MSKLPAVLRKYVVQKLTYKFREAVELTTVKMPNPGPKEVLVRNRYVGINASDINLTGGKYDFTPKPPFDCGMEGLGEVAAVGNECSRVQVGQPVAYIKPGAFAEYTVVPEYMAVPVPSVRPEYISLLISGLTAAISLDKVGEIKKGDTVLITAAAGGTGQFAVQIAKNAGCHVIGTCSSAEKAEFLKTIGCDRPIIYTTENLKDVLRKEYPNGVDVVYETIGGDFFDICLRNLARFGRMIVIGFISGYESEVGFRPFKVPALQPLLLGKSSSVRGFLLFHYVSFYIEYLQRLAKMNEEGQLKTTVDIGNNYQKGPFLGIETIPDAVEYLYTKKNVGKIVVDLKKPSSHL